ncbi:MAG TPA: hypothetical protein VMT77_10460, partial [Gemmatimonadales bacterium]|nr:hypothetical protein [Gemmatimonadales bacterium]
MTGLVLWLAAWLGAAVPAETLTVSTERGERAVAVTSERGWPAVAAPELAAALGAAAPVSRVGGASLVAAGRRFDFVLDAAYFRCGDRVFALAAPPYLAR